jgi:hypothetical protein
MRIRPASILDVGCGLGVYGMLCRIYLDLYDDPEFFEKLKEDRPKEWGITIDGIEGFQGYLRFIPRWAYNDIIIGDALEILSHKQEGGYDLILALAILEHLSKEDGFRFLGELRRVGRRVIVATPKEFKEQVVPDNPYETHKSHWTYTDFINMGFNRFIPHWGEWIAIYDKDIKESGGPVELGSIDIGGELKRIEDLLIELNNNLVSSLQQQTLILDRLSLSIRLKGFLGRLKDILKKG